MIEKTFMIQYVNMHAAGKLCRKVTLYNKL